MNHATQYFVASHNDPGVFGCLIQLFEKPLLSVTPLVLRIS